MHIETMRLFNFGEPFLHPELDALLPVVKAQNFKVDRLEISTHGMIFDEERLRSLLNSGILTHLYLSCDGDGTPADFERLRPPAKWNKLLRFLEGVGRLRVQMNSPVKLQTRTICTSLDGQARWRGLLEPLGWTPEFRPWQILPNTPGNQLGRAPVSTNSVCWPMKGVHLFVNYRGDVIPCCTYPALPPLGNLLSQKFSEVYRGTPRKTMLHQLRNQRVQHPICGQCEA